MCAIPVFMMLGLPVAIWYRRKGYGWPRSLFMGTVAAFGAGMLVGIVVMAFGG